MLPATLLLEKNKLDAKYPWLLLLEFILHPGQENETIYRFVRNYQDITFQGHTYTGFNFSLGFIEESTESKIPTVSLVVCNVTQYLQPVLEAEDGAVDSKVRIIVVHSDLLAEDYSELTLEYDVIAPHIEANSISFQLGAPSPFKQRFPRYRYFTDMCPFVFKSARCGYTGAATSCDHRFKDCKSLGNQTRFGGVPGLTS